MTGEQALSDYSSQNVKNVEGMLPSSKGPQHEINPYPSPIL